MTTIEKLRDVFYNDNNNTIVETYQYYFKGEFITHNQDDKDYFENVILKDNEFIKWVDENNALGD